MWVLPSVRNQINWKYEQWQRKIPFQNNRMVLLSLNRVNVMWFFPPITLLHISDCIRMTHIITQYLLSTYQWPIVYVWMCVVCKCQCACMRWFDSWITPWFLMMGYISNDSQTLQSNMEECWLNHLKECTSILQIIPLASKVSHSRRPNWKL